MPHRRLHRATFVAAGVYNLLWGGYAILAPAWIFRLADQPSEGGEPVFACLGMVLALYGILYLDVARSPETGWLIAAVGLAGKVLGPIGPAYLIITGEWPARTFFVIITNDLIWWIPFALYLHDAWPFYRRDLRHAH